MHKHVAILSLSSALFFAPPARAAGAAGEWAISFPAKTVGAYLPATRSRVIVVGAGEDAASSEQAARALRAALRASGRTTLVMDASAVGAAGAMAILDDQSIVKKVGALSIPIDDVVIVRVFPGGGEGADSAVVTMYDKKGATVTAFSVQRGEALGPPSASTTGQGVSNEAAGAVSRVLHEDKPAVATDAEKEYKRKYVKFYRVNVYYVQAGVVTQHLGTAYQGDQERQLGWPAFFEIVGHKEHAAFYRSRSRLKGLLIGPGVVAFVAGLGVATAGAMYGLLSPFCKAQDAGHRCIDSDMSPNWPMLGAGAGVAVVGLGALIAGVSIKAFPTTTAETIDLAAEYDKKLRQDLGLPPEEKESQRETPPSPSLSLVPALSPRGGGISLSLTF